MKWQGVIPAIMTPFGDDLSVDAELLPSPTENPAASHGLFGQHGETTPSPRCDRCTLASGTVRPSTSVLPKGAMRTGVAAARVPTHSVNADKNVLEPRVLHTVPEPDRRTQAH